MLTIRTSNGKTYLSEKGIIRADHDKEAKKFSASFDDGRTVSIENVRSVTRRIFPKVKKKND